MANTGRRILSLAVTVMTVFSAFQQFSYAAEAGRRELLNLNFDGYNATPQAPGIPAGVPGSLNAAGIMYAEDAGGEYGNCVVIEDPNVVGPWFGTENYKYENERVALEFDVSPRTNSSRTEVRLYNNSNMVLMLMGLDSSMSFCNLTRSNAVSEEVFERYRKFTENEWYHFEFMLDFARCTYSVTVNGDEIGRDISFGDDHLLKTIRFTFRGAKGHETKTYFDNLKVYKLFDLPEITNVRYDGTTNTVRAYFNKKMQGDSFADGISLFMGSNKIEVPFSGEYIDTDLAGVYEIKPDVQLKAGRTYSVAVKENTLKCIDNGYVGACDESFTVMSDAVYTENALFSEADGRICINADAVNASGEPMKIYAVLGAYSGNSMTDCIVSEYTVGAGASEAIELSADGEGADGAAMYILDSEFTPICEPVIRPGSNIGSCVRGSAEVFASYAYDVAQGTIRVYGKTAPYEEVCVISVLGTDASESSRISAVMQTTATENGYYEVVFKNDESEFYSDDYVILVKSESEGAELAYKYSNNLESAEALNNVNAVDTYQAMEQIITEYSKVFALDLNDYNKLDSEKVCQLMLDEKKNIEYTEGAEFKRLFDCAVCITMLNTGKYDVKETISKYAEQFGFKADEFANLPDTKLASQIISGRTYGSFSEFKDAYEEAKILTVVSNAENASALREYLLGTYAGFFDLESDKDVWNKYNAIKEKAAVFGRCLSMDFTSKDKARKAFSDAVISVYEKENPVRRGGSSGGKSSGGGGGGVVTKVAQLSVEPKKTEDLLRFPDIDESDEKVVYYLVGKGIVCGDENGNFRPDDTIRRDEFVKMLVIMLGLKTDGATSNFEDVPSGNWAYPFVSAAYKNGIVNGFSALYFGAGENISRQDAVTMLYRAAKSAGLLKYASGNAAAEPGDGSMIADYAKEAMEFACGRILSVDKEGRVYPERAATRMETADMIYNFMNLAQGGKV
ncbi:MAG: S-layer homology domain-containing protein [Clostridia bacterium]|nr:S-layer homology domain-containing protein [Clostridia bacterium]